MRTSEPRRREPSLLKLILRCAGKRMVLWRRKRWRRGLPWSDPVKGETSGAKRILSGGFSELFSNAFADKHDLFPLCFCILQKVDQYQQEEGLLRLPYRKQSLVSRISYAYDDRYIVEASMGATGSENFAQNHRWGIFPAVGIAWYISHEKIYAGGGKQLDQAETETSYGIAGNDNVFSQNGGLVRFPYRGQVTTDGPGYDLGLRPVPVAECPIGRWGVRTELCQSES